MERHINVLIADDQDLFAEGTKFLLEARSSDIRVVALAPNGEEAVSLAMELKPDIILMDVRMPIMDGVMATREIHRRDPSIRIVMLTTFDDDEYVHSALHNGAIGYLLKNRPPMELIHCIRAVQDGVMQIDPSVARSLIHPKEQEEKGPTVSDKAFQKRMGSLTSREREVLLFMTQALDNKQIASRLGVAEQTARNYISIIYSKLQVSGRIELINIMNRLGY